MAGQAIVELLQSLGRMPGLSFLDRYANQIIAADHLKRDKVDRAHELKGRADDIRTRTQGLGGRGGARDAAGSGSAGTAGHGSAQGGGSAGGAGRAATPADRAALRGHAGGNVDRLRQGTDPAPGRERLRRRRDTLD